MIDSDNRCDYFIPANCNSHSVKLAPIWATWLAIFYDTTIMYIRRHEIPRVPLYCSFLSWIHIQQCYESRKDIHGQTVLHYAAKSGNIKCLKLLLEKGVDIHAKVRHFTLTRSAPSTPLVVPEVVSFLCEPFLHCMSFLFIVHCRNIVLFPTGQQWENCLWNCLH